MFDCRVAGNEPFLYTDTFAVLQMALAVYQICNDMAEILDVSQLEITEMSVKSAMFNRTGENLRWKQAQMVASAVYLEFEHL